MIGAALELPDFKEFLVELDDPEVASDFLIHIVGLGYMIKEVQAGSDLRILPHSEMIELAKKYWAEVFLTEYPDYGKYDQ